MSDIDKQIAEFHAAGRRRKSIIFGISGALLLALGIVLLVVSFTLSGEDAADYGGYPVKIIVGGFVFVFAGLSSCYNAYRVGSGQVNDVDTDVLR